MVCPKCGNVNNDGIKFCTQCGCNLDETVNNNANTNKDVDVDNFVKNEMNVNNYNSLSDEYVNNVNYSNIDTNNVDKLNSCVSKSHNGLAITLSICLSVVIIGITVFILWKTFGNNVDKKVVNSNNSINTSDTNNTDNKQNNNDNKQNSDGNNTINNNSNSNKENDNNKIVTKFKNYNVDITMVMEVNDMTLTTYLTGTVDEENQLEYLKMNIEMYGMNVSSETYIDFKNGVSYISEPFSGGWIKQKGASQTVDLNSIIEAMNQMQNVNKIDDNHYKVVITNDDIKGLLSNSDTDFDDITGQMEADVYVNDGYIDEIKYDFSNLTLEFGEFTMDMKISNYNNAGSVTIPNEVLESATEY